MEIIGRRNQLSYWKKTLLFSFMDFWLFWAYSLIMCLYNSQGICFSLQIDLACPGISPPCTVYMYIIVWNAELVNNRMHVPASDEVITR